MLQQLSSLPTQMDYKGQKLAEQMFQGIILFSAIVGFIYGYVAEQFGWTVYIVMAGFAFFVFADTSSVAHLSSAPPQVVTCSRLRHGRQETRERRIKRHAKNN